MGSAPTAHASVADSADTTKSAVTCGPATGGSRVHWLPFQCRNSSSLLMPLKPNPTAQTSALDTALTPVISASAVATGDATCAQWRPSQCTSRACSRPEGSIDVPTVQASCGEILVTAARQEP